MASDSECYHLMSLPDKLEMDCSNSDEDSNCIVKMDESESDKNVVSPHPTPVLTQRTSEAADTLLRICFAFISRMQIINFCLALSCNA